MRANRIGIFGGTFNPVHSGHVAVADEFIKKLSLDVLYVIPNSISPFKNVCGVSGEDRMKMLSIAFSGREKVVVSDIELAREGASYTCDTVSDIKKMHPDGEIYLLMGDDCIDDFDKWRNFEYIAENAFIVVASREKSKQELEKSLERIKRLTGREVYPLGNDVKTCSSTGFRSAHGKASLPDGVYKYIKERGLYGI